MFGFLHLSSKSFICCIIISFSLYVCSLLIFFILHLPAHWLGSKRRPCYPSICLLKFFLLTPVTNVHCPWSYLSVCYCHRFTLLFLSPLYQQHVVFWDTRDWFLSLVVALLHLPCLGYFLSWFPGAQKRLLCYLHTAVLQGVDSAVAGGVEIGTVPTPWSPKLLPSFNLFLPSQGHLGGRIHFRGGG